jgi:uncharacterized protein (DUF58 family)
MVPVSEPLLRGAYVDLHDLLALRFRPLTEPRLASSVVSARGGTRLSRQRGRGIDFSEVRLYQPGDDVRTIDWRVTARKQVPHTKVFREERERLTLLVVDQTQSMFFGSRLRLKSVAAAEYAAMAAWRAIRHHDRVGAVIIGNRARGHPQALPQHQAAGPPARRSGDLQSGAGGPAHRCPSRAPQRRAAAGAAAGAQPLPHLLRQRLRPPSRLWRDAFRALARHNELVAIRVFDPLERELPPADRYTVTDGAHRWQFDAGDRACASATRPVSTPARAPSRRCAATPT